ncbi:hypothetical protein Tco_0238523 [Tanacetum coccineum]
MRQRRWLELLADYDCEIRYHPGKANVSSKKKHRLKKLRDMDKHLKYVILLGELGDLERNSKWNGHLEQKDQIIDEYVAGDLKEHVRVKRAENGKKAIPVLLTTRQEDYYYCGSSHFTSRFWQSLQNALGTQLDMILKATPLRTLRSIIADPFARLTAPRDRQRKLLQVSFDSENEEILILGTLDPFKILKRIGPVAYKLELPEELMVANSTTKAEYVVVANCCGQVLWIQNQMLDYEFNFMNTKIYIDNESIICIVKNPVFHSKTKHIEIRHHFIGDSYEKKLIQVIKIHTDHNVADLLTKAFDVSRDKFENQTGSCKAKHIEYMNYVKSQTPRQAKRGRDTKIPQSGGPPKKVGDEAVHKELGDKMERAATTASSLEAEQDSGNINRTQSMATLNESFP